MSFQLYTPQTAPEGSKENLEAIEAQKGHIPNILKVFAGAPPVLQAFLDLDRLMEATSFSPTERGVIFLTVSHRNGSGYCTAAHSKLALEAGLPEELIESLKQGEPLKDDKLEALRQYTLGIMANRGRPSDDRINAFLAAGYKPEQALEVVLGITLKTLTNYTMRLAHPPVDGIFHSAGLH